MYDTSEKVTYNISTNLSTNSIYIYIYAVGIKIFLTLNFLWCKNRGVFLIAC